MPANFREVLEDLISPCRKAEKTTRVPNNVGMGRFALIASVDLLR